MHRDIINEELKYWILLIELWKIKLSHLFFETKNKLWMSISPTWRWDNLWNMINYLRKLSRKLSSRCWFLSWSFKINLIFHLNAEFTFISSNHFFLIIIILKFKFFFLLHFFYSLIIIFIFQRYISSWNRLSRAFLI